MIKAFEAEQMSSLRLPELEASQRLDFGASSPVASWLLQPIADTKNNAV